jgi:hypothetical protein
MSNLKGNKEDNRIDAPYHNQFYRIADMLATPCADKRVDSLSTMSEARGFKIDEIISFTEYWLATQSKFPVLADIYAFTKKSLKQVKECDHIVYMPISKDWFTSYRDDGMRRLKALCLMIDQYRIIDTKQKWCCYFTENENVFFNLFDDQKKKYNNTSLEEIERAYKITLNKLKDIQRPASFQNKNERGCQD